MGRPSRNLAANTGISVKLITMDTSTAMRQRPTQRREKLTIDADDESQRHKNQHGGKRRTDHGARDFSGSRVDRIALERP